MAETLILFGLLREEIGIEGSGECVERHNNVSGVSNLLEFDVGDLLVVHLGGVMSRDKPWELREVGNHSGMYYYMVI